MKTSPAVEHTAEAGIHARWAECVLDNLPGSGSCCATVSEQLAAAQVHASLAIAARLGEVADAIRASGEDMAEAIGELAGITSEQAGAAHKHADQLACGLDEIRAELKDIRCGGINVAVV